MSLLGEISFIRSFCDTNFLASEFEDRDIRCANELRVVEDELHVLKGQNSDFSQRNSEFKVMSEKLKNDLELKDTIIEKLQKEINTVNE